ncbi:MAG: DNA primase [Bacteroidales bacterium]|nr:DNA primase [Bacteroidales bacterium]
MIDRATVDKILDTADIVEVIGEFVNLKKSGQNYKGLSPFTNEKTPSFFVSPAKGIYKCFSSGSGGNAVKFLMEHEKLSYPEALKFLAKKYNIEIIEKELTADEIQQQNERESLLAICNYANTYFQENLKNTEEGKAVGLSYFLERGFREPVIDKFQLGYSREQRDAFSKTAISKGYKIDYLVKTGLTIKKENYTFDRFHGRVIFPIHSLSGQVLGFGGRILKKQENAAKYLNSPESDIYHKSNILYGLYFARQTIIKHDKCFMVEGYTDVLSMHQAGIENTVASSGTALTLEQIRLLKRFTKNITVIYDGDEAGIKASLRGIDLILEEGLNVKVVLLPEGEDPDSFAKSRNASDFIAHINASETDFISFKTKLLSKDAENDPVKKATLITDIVRSVAVIPDGITRTVYIRECSKILDIDEKMLYTETHRLRRQKYSQKVRPSVPYEELRTERPIPARPQSKETEVYTIEKEIIRLLLLYGNNEFTLLSKSRENKKFNVANFIIREIESDDLEISHPLYKVIFEEIKKLVNENQKIEDRYFINHPEEGLSALTVDILTSNYILSKIWQKNDNHIETEEMKLNEIVPETIKAFKNKRVLNLIRETQHEIKEAQENNDLENISLLQQRYIVLNELKKGFSKDLGDRIIV